MRKTFTAQDQYLEFFAGRFGVSIGVTIEAGTNSLEVVEYINGIPYKIGNAITTTGARVRLDPTVDYTPGAKIRVTIPTFQTGPVHVDVDGDYLSIHDGTLANPGAAFNRVTDAEDERITDDGEIRILESA